MDVCDQFIEARVVSPATLKMGQPTEAEQEDADTWRVWGFFDSQNRLGALLRADYVCVVTYVGDDKWRLDSLDIRPR